jgi:hypothetical protein
MSHRPALRHSSLRATEPATTRSTDPQALSPARRASARGLLEAAAYVAFVRAGTTGVSAVEPRRTGVSSAREE